MIAVPTIPINAARIKAFLLPRYTILPAHPAPIIKVKVAQDPTILSFIVAELPDQLNLAFKAGVI